MKTEEVTPAQIARECVDNFDFDSYEEPAECTRVYGNAVCYWCGRVAGQCECQCQREGWRPTTI